MSGRARSTSTLTTLASTFCPATTSTTNTSIVRTEGRRSCDSATAAATTMTTTVLPSCVIARSTDVEKSVAFVAPHVAKPRSTRARPGVRTHHPEQDADRDRADDDGGERNGQEKSGRHLRIDTCAHERAHRRVGFDLAADDGAGSARRGRDRRPASGGPQPRRPRRPPMPRPPEPARSPSKGLPNVQSVKPKCMQTPSTAAGAVGVASQPTRARPSSQPDARTQATPARPVRSRTGRSRRASGRATRRPPAAGRRGADDVRRLRRTEHRDDRSRPDPDEDRLRRVFGLGCRGQPLVRAPADRDVERPLQLRVARRRQRSPSSVSRRWSCSSSAVRRCWREIGFLVIALVLEVVGVRDGRVPRRSCSPAGGASRRCAAHVELPVGAHRRRRRALRRVGTDRDGTRPQSRSCGRSRGSSRSSPRCSSPARASTAACISRATSRAARCSVVRASPSRCSWSVPPWPSLAVGR